MSGLYQLDIPFFERSSSIRQIEELAVIENLTIYAGAGISVDRTNMDWNELIANLISEVGSSKSFSKDIVNTLGVLPSGSAVAQNYLDWKGKKQSKVAISQQLRTQLYRSHDWLGGRASSAIAHTWVNFTRRGKTLSILTTNYDEHIELDIPEAVALWNRRRGPSDSKLETPKHIVQYLHGKIPRVGKITDFPVISEHDYFEREHTTRKCLEERFAQDNVLIMGSSLTDPPLIHVLLATRQSAQENGLRRWAMVPLVDLQATDASERSEAIIANHAARLKHLGVQGIYLDHYFQVAQVLAEARIAAELGPGNYSQGHDRYGDRLHSWWIKWNSQINSHEAYVRAQYKHHSELQTQLAQIKKLMNAQDEQIKIEVWLRWNPSTSNRKLRLWASTFALFSDWRNCRTADILLDNSYSCIRTFCNGRADYARNPNSNERWQTFLAFPIRLMEQVNIAVGSVVIASMTSPEQSRLGERFRAEHAFHLSDFNEVASRIAETSIV